MPDTIAALSAGSIDDLAKSGYRVVHGAERPIVVFYNNGNILAVENSCPHMGFPLHRGSCVDGVITCPWHHARFDGKSGCTYDLWAGDAAPYDVEVRDGVVYVSELPRSRNLVARARLRLREALETNNALALAKSILTLQNAGRDDDLTRDIALYGVDFRDDWASGMTVHASTANLMPHLSAQTAYLARYQSGRRVSEDSQGSAPRRRRYPIENGELDSLRLRELMKEWVSVRHRNGSERTLLTAVSNDIGQVALAELVLEACALRIYSDTGHPLDFANKALEMLDSIGWEHAEQVLPAILSRIMFGGGAEENPAWIAPDNLVELSRTGSEGLEELAAGSDGLRFHSVAELAERILSHNPRTIVASIRAAASAGASAAQLAQAVAYAAGVRVAQFHTANEFSDWVTVLHSFTYCHAVHALLRRSRTSVGVSAVVHGAMTVYLNRFLNIPALKLPDTSSGAPQSGDEILNDLSGAFDGRPESDLAGRLTASYYDQGYELSPLIDCLTQALLREDFDFHTMQMLEAAVAESVYWPRGVEQRTLLVAAARYLAAFAPTRRTQHQTASIALRLHRGERMFDDDALPSE